MIYLVAHCPMLACNHANLVCTLPAENMPLFEPTVYVAVKCANCGEIFREPAGKLEVRQVPIKATPLQKDWHYS